MYSKASRIVIFFFIKFVIFDFLGVFFSDSLRSSTYSVETFCNCTAFGTCFLSLGGACIFRFWFFFLNKIFVLIPNFSFFQGCLLTGCLNGGSCVFDKKENVFSCLCKIPWTGTNVKIKTVRFVLLF